MIIPSDILRVNLGRLPFVHTPPEGYLPLENPSNPSSSWLTRFEHGVSVVEVVQRRTSALPRSVIDMAFAAETTSAEAKQLTLTLHSRSPTIAFQQSPFRDPAASAVPDVAASGACGGKQGACFCACVVVVCVFTCLYVCVFVCLCVCLLVCCRVVSVVASLCVVVCCLTLLSHAHPMP